MLPIRPARSRLLATAIGVAFAISGLTAAPAAVADPAPTPVDVADYTGQRAYDAAMAPDGMTLYVPNHGSDSISVIDVDSMRQTGVIEGFTGIAPYSMAISPDGSFAYVAADGIYVIDLATRTQIGVVPSVPGTNGRIGFSADGSRAYVTDGFNQALHVIDTATHTRRAQIWGFTGYLLAGVTESPDGSIVLVANYGSNTVQIVDPRTNRVTGRVANYTGRVPGTVTFSLDGTTAYVSNEESHSVSVIDMATRAEVASIPVGQGASRMTLSSDGAYLFVAAPRDGSVTIVDTAARAPLGNLPGYTGDYPRGIALSADGDHIFVAENVGNKVVRVPVPPMTAAVSTMTPNRGSADGGVEVTMTGEFLAGSTAVTFDGIPGTDLTVASDGRSLTVVAPAHDAGSVDVVVEHPRGNATVREAFSYFTVPDAPVNVTASPGHESVELSWDAPMSDGGAEISSYAIMHAPTGTDDWTVVTETSETSAVATDLDNGTEYMFRVAAKNEAGMGAHHELRAMPGSTVIDPTPAPSENPTPPGTPDADSALASTGADSTAAAIIGFGAAGAGAVLLTLHLLRRRTRSLAERI